VFISFVQSKGNIHSIFPSSSSFFFFFFCNFTLFFVLKSKKRYREFKELQGRCERLLEAKKMVDRCKEDLDEALKVMMNASKELERARAKEEELAELISDDHVEADKV
jgi:hypothetical protein